MIQFIFRLRRTACLAVTIVLAVALISTGCGRPLAYVELAPMTFASEAAPIDGTIELCLSRKFRVRQWNVEDHPFKVELGPRAALNVEIMAKAAFRTVVTSFDETCGASTGHPWLGANILAANRDWDSIWAREQNTTITMQFELVADDGRIIWSTTTRGHVSDKPALWTQRRDRAARDFGRALEIAIRAGFEELIGSEAVRSEFGADAAEATDSRPQTNAAP